MRSEGYCIYLVCLSVCPHIIKSNDVSTAANNGSTSGISVASLIAKCFKLCVFAKRRYGVSQQRVRAYLVFVTNEASLLVKKLKLTIYSALLYSKLASFLHARHVSSMRMRTYLYMITHSAHGSTIWVMWRSEWFSFVDFLDHRIPYSFYSCS